MIVDTKSSTIIAKEKYWNINNYLDSNNKKFNNFYLYEILKKSVHNRLIGDVDVGCFLSGGFDSSLIAFIASRIIDDNLKTFSIGFNEKEFDESKNAKAIANFIGSNHTQYNMDVEGLIKYIPEISKASDQPFADSSLIPTLALCNLARKSVKVCLSGDGADEFFGGYERYRRSLIFQKIKPYNLITLKILGILNKFLEFTNYPKNFKDRLIKIDFLLRTRNLEHLYDEILSLGIGINFSKPLFAESIKRDLKRDSNFNYSLKYLLINDINHYLTEDILVKGDRASMRYGLEVRNPFLNNDILKTALSYHSNSLSDLRLGKKPLRSISNNIFPEKMILKKKKGFAVPIKFWLKKPLKKWSDELINESYLVKNNYINGKVLSEIYKDHQEERRNWSHQIWGILMFEDWYRNHYI